METPMSKSRDVYIVDGRRTPFLKAKGKPGPFLASDLAVNAARPLLLQNHIDKSKLDEVIVGCVMPTADEANIARIIALRLGIPDSVPAWTVQRNCASGMQSLDCAFQNIQQGKSNLILAGGTESMSHAPVIYNDLMVNWLSAFMGAKTLKQKISLFSKLRPIHLKPIIALVRGLSDPIVGLSMGQTTEEIAYRFNINRDQMDQYAITSHQRLGDATDKGHLDEIEAIYDNAGAYFDSDDGIRRDSSVPNLAKLKPYFDRKYGMVTPGNSAQITDGAAMLLLASKSAVKQYKLPVLAKITDSQWAGLNPSQMGLGPAHAMAPILKRHKLNVNDIDNWEINEAFAVVTMAAMRDLDLDHDKVNIHGGACAMGHPIGASGARILVTLISALRTHKKKRGIAALCIGGGEATAMAIEVM